MAAVYTFSLHYTYNGVIITKNSEHLLQCSQHARYLWQHITHKCPRSSLHKLYCTWQNQCFVMPRKLGHPTPLHTVVQTTEPSCNKPSYAVHINLQPHDHWKSPYKDISLQHHKNGGRIWDCLSHSGSTNSPAGKTPHQYSGDHQEKWVQFLAHIVHCDMWRDLWILVL